MNRRAIALEVVLLAACCAFLFFYGLGNFGLLGADEPRYAQVAREMLERKDWVTPVLYGQPWLEKPILYYWRAMIFFKAFGVSDWAARLPSATLAALMVAFTYFWTWRFRPKAKLDAALMVAASAAVIGFARAASIDMSLAAPFTIAMLCWFTWFRTEHRGWLAAFYFFSAVGMLAKGPVAPFLAAIIIVAFALLMRDARLIMRTLWLPGILLFLVVALPWYIAVQLQNPEFLRVFIFEHNLARFGTNVFRHKQPFWYYIPVLLLSVMPWTLFVVAGLVDAVRKLRDRLQSKADDDGVQAFLLLWIVIPIVFFSISQSKLPGYILPVIPPCLILAAIYLHARWERDERPAIWMVAAHASVLAVLAAALALAPFHMLPRVLRGPIPVQATMLAAGVGTVTFIAIALLLLLRGRTMLRSATLALAILGVGYILRGNVGLLLDLTQSERPVARQIMDAAPGVSTVATFKAPRQVEYGLAFYRNQPISVYERLEIPAGEHLVLCRSGCEEELREISPGRSVRLAGSYSYQNLQMFVVGAK